MSFDKSGFLKALKEDTVFFDEVINVIGEKIADQLKIYEYDSNAPRGHDYDRKDDEIRYDKIDR